MRNEEQLIQRFLIPHLDVLLDDFKDRCFRAVMVSQIWILRSQVMYEVVLQQCRPPIVQFVWIFVNLVNPGGRQ